MNIFTIIEITVMVAGGSLHPTAGMVLLGAGIGTAVAKAIQPPQQDAILEHIKKEVRRR